MKQRGGKRENSGRKSKAEELKVAEIFRNVLEDETVVTKLAERVEEGDIKAIELWLGYIYGKPKQATDITSGNKPITITFKDAE
jgi:hypothetical protein